MTADESAEIVLEEIETQIDEIKQELNEENQETQKETKEEKEFRLFSQLLQCIKETENEKLILLCRQIERVEVDENFVHLVADELAIQELGFNKVYYEVIKSFFIKQNLNLVIEHTNDENTENILKNWFDKKLSIID